MLKDALAGFRCSDFSWVFAGPWRYRQEMDFTPNPRWYRAAVDVGDAVARGHPQPLHAVVTHPGQVLRAVRPGVVILGSDVLVVLLGAIGHGTCTSSCNPPRDDHSVSASSVRIGKPDVTCTQHYLRLE